MDNVNRVFFPLRSNVGWFQSRRLQEEIANNVKQSILLYDEIYVEDGNWMAQLTDSGSISSYSDPDQIPANFRSIEFERDLKPSYISSGIKSPGKDKVILMSGDSIAKFKIDYYKIFDGIERSDYNFLKFVVLEYQIPKTLIDIIEYQTSMDIEQFGSLHPPFPLSQLIIENLNHDIVISTWLESAIALDSKHQEMIERKCNSYSNLKLTKSPIAFGIHELLRFSAPDFSNITMKAVLELREEKGWQNLRSAVTGIVSTIQDSPEIFNDPEALEKAIHYECDSAIFKEFEKSYSNKRNTIIDLALGGASFLPMIGSIPSAIGVGRTIYNYLDKRNSWSAFLIKLKKFH